MQFPKIPGLPDAVQNFLLYLFLFMALPLIPVALEFVIMKRITEQSLMITTAMYAIGIGIASRSKALFGITVLICIFFSSLFGVVMHAEHGKKELVHTVIEKQKVGDKSQVDGIQRLNDDELPQLAWFAYGAIVFVSMIHAAERYNRHVFDGKPVFEF